MNYRLFFACAFICVALCGCTSQEVSLSDNASSMGLSENTISVSESETEVQSTENSTSVSENPIEIGDDIYIVSQIPTVEKATLSCEYGTALRYEGATAEVYGKTLDFSSVC